MYRRSGAPFGERTQRYRPEVVHDGDGMDIDHPPNLIDRYAVEAGEQGPRKRQHGELGESRPFQPNPHVPAQHFTPNQPFLFHLNDKLRNQSIPVHPPHPPPLRPFAEYGPEVWKGMTMDTFNTNPSPAPRSYIPEVDMDAEPLPAAQAPAEAHGQGQEQERGGGSGSGSGSGVIAATLASFGKVFGSAERDTDAVGIKTEPGVSEDKVDIKTEPDLVKQEDTQERERDQHETGPRKIATGAISRVRKRREREWRRRNRGSDTEGEDDDRSVRSFGSLKTEHTYHHHHNLSAPGMRHSEIPALLLGYLQFFVNASIVVFLLYLVVLFVLTVRRDVNDRMAEASIEIMQEISECTQLYLTNRCAPAVRVPAMESACKTWDICMHRDPTMIGRTNVMVETFAGVINSFVEQISWRTMGFALITLSFMVALANSALFNLRQNASVDHSVPVYPPPQPHHLQWRPQIPAHAGGAGQVQHGHHGVAPGMLGSALPSEGAKQIGWEEKKKGWW